MSIVRMRKVFRSTIRVKVGRKHLRLPSLATIVFGAIVVIFVVGAYYTFGAPTTGGGGQEQAVARVAPVVATVNGHKIQRAVFERAAYAAFDRSSMKGVAMLGGIRQETLDGIIEEILLRDAAKAEGIRVTTADIAAKRDEFVEMRISMQYPTRKDLRDALSRQDLSLEQLQAKERERLPEDDVLREIVARERLQELAESRVQVTEQDLLDSYTTVKYQPIMVVPELVEVEHRKQWAKDHPAPETAPGDAESTPPQAPEPPQIDADAIARQKAEEFLTRIRAGEDLVAVAKQNPYDPFGDAAGGIQEMVPGQLPASIRALETAVFALKLGEVSEVISIPGGHFIVRATDRAQKLPENFETDKETLREQLLDRRKHEAWADYIETLKANARIEILDPELRGRQLLQQGRIAEAERALQQAVTDDAQNLSAMYTLASLYADQQNSDQAIRLLSDVTAQADGARDPIIHMRLGELLQEKGRAEEALASYQKASEWAGGKDYMNFRIHLQLKQIFTELGQPELAKQEDEWIAQYTEQNQGMLGGLPGGMMTIPPPGP